MELVKRKKIKVILVKKGDKIQVEKDIHFDILWPKTQLMNENVLNNNSIVAKLQTKQFSMLFTGDIEQKAEELLQKENIDLKADILKVAHHGSKTSSTNSFLKTVNPKICLIGVGKNNNFGHPSEEVLERLKENRCRIFRTDLGGEITIKVNKKGKITIRNCIKETNSVNTTKN